MKSRAGGGKPRKSVNIGEFGDAAQWLKKQGMFFADGAWHYADGRTIGQDGLPAILAFYENEMRSHARR